MYSSRLHITAAGPTRYNRYVNQVSDPKKLAEVRDQKVAELHARAEEEHARKLAANLELDYVDTRSFPIDGSALTLRPKEAQISAGSVILKNKANTLTVGSMNPSLPAFTQFKESLESEGYKVTPLVISRTGLAYALEAYEKFAHVNIKVTGEVAVSEDKLLALSNEINTVEDLTERLEAAGPEDVSVIVELLLGGAIRFSASDIHIEPLKSGKDRIRYRLDGVLHDVAIVTKNISQMLLERIKLLASLKLNVHDAAQDGRFTIHVTDRDIEIRASALPGPLGEYIVLRLLDPNSLIDIPQLGLRDDLLEVVHQQLAQPNGMLLTTGPTGSGKTTMLYAFLKHVSSPEVKVITIEDPIEYKLEGIEQTQVNEAQGYTFAKGLRSIVRQDPDIVLVGEIRDKETADTALQAALTGHLVFSTLHANDAAGAVPRLTEIGAHVESVGPAINVIMAQRLVRRVCPHCAEAYKPDAEEAKRVATAMATIPEDLPHELSAETELKRSKGCAKCHNTGYQGRMGIFEVFPLDDDAESTLADEQATANIRKYAIARGMVTLQQDALLRVLDGTTTVEEVVRVTGPLREPHLDHPGDKESPS